jgi:hypothetical protein
MGAAVGGAFGSLVIGLAWGAYLFVSRRRSRHSRAHEKVDNGFGTFMDAPSKAVAPAMTLP